jgi:hypothetical protein
MAQYLVMFGKKTFEIKDEALAEELERLVVEVEGKMRLSGCSCSKIMTEKLLKIFPIATKPHFDENIFF